MIKLLVRTSSTALPSEEREFLMTASNPPEETPPPKADPPDPDEAPDAAEPSSPAALVLIVEFKGDVETVAYLS